MHITIDTNNVTPEDRSILAQVLGLYEVQHVTKAVDGASTDDGQTATPAAEPEQPKRARRTKLEIAFDTAKEAHDADPTELAALVSAAEDLKAKDPGNERLKDFNPDDYQPTPASEDADSDADQESPAAEPETTADSISMEELKDLATKLISTDRQAMVELLKQFSARRLSEIPESDWGKFASEIRSKLA